MIGNIQPLADIQQADKKEEKKRSSDPIQAEYEDGQDFLKENDLTQAAVAFHNALRGYEEKKHQDGIANCSNQLGNVCLQKGDFDKARQHYLRAWEICERFDDSMSLLSLSGQLVAVYRGLGEYDKAMTLCLDMLETHNRNNNPKDTVDTMELLADIYLDQDEKAKAADAYRTIASIHTNYKHMNFAKRFMDKAEELER
jgi:tetratricopeptide (TPR) repeat protein